jgi:Tfp pilus assembly protein PilF
MHKIINVSVKDTQSSTIIFILLLIFLAGIAFLPLYPAEFLGWDDQLHILTNPMFTKVSLNTFAKIWLEPYQMLYIPITYTIWGIIVWILQLIFGMDWASGNSIYIFTILNFCTHLFNTYLVFKLLKLFLKDQKIHLILLGTSIFLLHPIQVESVAWISGFRDLLSATFSLLGLIFYLQSKNKLLFAAFILAILCKPTSLMLAILIPLLEIHSNIIKEKSLSFRNYKVSIFLILIAIPFIFFTKWLQPNSILKNVPEFMDRSIVAVDSLGFYISKILCPLHLAPDYGRRPQFILSMQPAIEPFYLLIFLISLSIWYWKDPKCRNSIVVSVILIFTPLTPVLGFVPFAFQKFSTVADRYLYVSLLGVGLMLITALSHFKRPIFWMIPVLLLFSYLSMNQSRTWKTNLSFTKNLSKLYPNNPNAEVNLGVYLSANGKQIEAAEHFKKALEMDPLHYQAASNLGTVLIDLSEYEQAEIHLKKIGEIQPKNVEAIIDYGILLTKQMRIVEAEAKFKEAIKLDSQNSFAIYNYSILLLKQGKVQQSYELLQKAIQIDPYDESYQTQFRGLKQLIDEKN